MRTLRALALLAVGLAAPAAAQDHAPTADASAEALWDAARTAEAAADPAAAVARYRQLRAAHPRDRLAARAQRRLEFLEARSEGGYVPLATLMRTQADPTAASVAELERAMQSFPPGTVRREAHVMVATRWLALGQPERSADSYRVLLAEPDLPEPEARRARSGLARALQRAGRPGAALEVLEAAGEGQSPVAEAIAAEERSKVGRAAALVVIALFLLTLAWRTRLRLGDGLRAWHLALGAWLLGVPIVLARQYDAEATDTFGLLALASAPILIGSAALGRHARGRLDRALLAAGAVSAELAVGYLVLVERGAVLGVLQ